MLDAAGRFIVLFIRDVQLTLLFECSSQQPPNSFPMHARVQSVVGGLWPFAQTNSHQVVFAAHTTLYPQRASVVLIRSPVHLHFSNRGVIPRDCRLSCTLSSAKSTSHYTSLYSMPVCRLKSTQHFLIVRHLCIAPCNRCNHCAGSHLACSTFTTGVDDLSPFS